MPRSAFIIGIARRTLAGLCALPFFAGLCFAAGGLAWSEPSSASAETVSAAPRNTAPERTAKALKTGLKPAAREDRIVMATPLPPFTPAHLPAATAGGKKFLTKIHTRAY